MDYSIAESGRRWQSDCEKVKSKRRLSWSEAMRIALDFLPPRSELPSLMRLNRFLAAAGLGSRRSCEELIRDGLVTINGKLCTELATQVVPTDSVKANGRLIHTEQPVYILLNKPAGYLCTHDDEHSARKTIYDLLSPNLPRLFHIGRLDKESEGLLILTNDGDLSLKLTHPRYKMDKEYAVTLDKPFDFTQREKLLHGFHIEGGWAKAENICKLSEYRLTVTLRQGLKRQIRLMFFKLGYEVRRLTRTRIGPLRDTKLAIGQSRSLTANEIQQLNSTEPKKDTPKSRAAKSEHRRTEAGNGKGRLRG